MTQWQPISTAPKDGTSLLLFCTKFAGELSGEVEIKGVDIGAFTDGQSDYPGNGWWDAGGDYYACWCWPTHWMPLPSPPKGIE